MFLRDLNFPVAHHDARRLEVVADGLPLLGGAQFAVDTTLVSPVQANGHPHHRCAEERKQLTHPELSGVFGRAGLVVLATEVGGCCHLKPTLSFASWPRQRRAIQAWCVALSLLERRPALGCDGDTLSTSDIVAACRHLPLCCEPGFARS